MRKRMMRAVALLAMATAVVGCAPRTVLDTAELKDAAVAEKADEIAEALSTLDERAIERLTCEKPWRVAIPGAERRPVMPLPVEVHGVETLSPRADGWTYEDPDPGAEFHLASFLSTADDPGDARRVSLDAIIRVDEREACLWAMDAPFAVFLGL